MHGLSRLFLLVFPLAGYGCLCHYYYLLFRATFASIILGGGGGGLETGFLSLYCNEGSGSRVPMVGGEGGGLKGRFMERDYDGISLLGMRVVVGVLFHMLCLSALRALWGWRGSVEVEWGLCGGGL